MGWSPGGGLGFGGVIQFFLGQFDGIVYISLGSSSQAQSIATLFEQTA